MPIIPVQTPQLSLETPGADVSGVSPVGTMTNALGEVISNISETIGTKLLKADAVEQSHTAHAEDQIDAEAKWQELKDSSPDGFVYDDPGIWKKRRIDPQTKKAITITDEYKAWANERYEQRQSQMTSRLAQDSYIALAQPYFTQESIKMDVQRDQMLHDSWDSLDKARRDNLANHSIDRYLNSPVAVEGSSFGGITSSFYTKVDGELSTINATGVSREIPSSWITKKQTEAKHELARNAATGALDRIITGTTKKSVERNKYVDDFISWLSDSAKIDNEFTAWDDEHNRRINGLERMSTMLSPEDKNSLIARAEGMRSSPKEKITNLNSEFKNLEEDIRSGTAKFDTKAPPTLIRAKEMVQKGEIKLDHYSDLYGDVRGAEWERKTIGRKADGSSIFFLSSREAMYAKARDMRVKISNEVQEHIRATFPEYASDPRYRIDVMGNAAGAKSYEKVVNAIDKELGFKKNDTGGYIQRHGGDNRLKSALGSVDLRYFDQFSRVAGDVGKSIANSYSIQKKVFGRGETMPVINTNLSNDQKDSIAAGIENSMNSLDEDRLSALFIATRDNMHVRADNGQLVATFPILLKELSREKRLNAGYQYLAIAPNIRTQKQIYRAIKTPIEKIQEDYRLIASGPARMQAITARVAENMDKYRMARDGSYDAELASEQGRFVEKLALKMGLEDRNLTENEAADGAYQSLIGQWQQVYQGGGKMWNSQRRRSTITIPNVTQSGVQIPEEDKPAIAEAAMNKIDPKWLRENRGVINPSRLPQELWDDHVLKNGRIVNHIDTETHQEGVIITVPAVSAKMRLGEDKLMTDKVGKYHVLSTRDTHGALKPIFISFDELKAELIGKRDKEVVEGIVSSEMKKNIAKKAIKSEMETEKKQLNSPSKRLR